MPVPSCSPQNISSPIARSFDQSPVFLVKHACLSGAAQFSVSSTSHFQGNTILTDATHGDVQATSQPENPAFVSLLAGRIAKITVIIAALFAIYTEGAGAYLNTQKAFEAKAVADNALLRQQSEGEIAEQKARTELETARNAAERQKAEAEKAEADAVKAEADATTARNVARNAARKTLADAETIKAEAEFRQQKVTVLFETARNAARRQSAEADKIEADVAAKKQANAAIKHLLDVTDCSKPYHPKNFADDFGDIFARRAQCGR
jgi:hypothetical protein